MTSSSLLNVIHIIHGDTVYEQSLNLLIEALATNQPNSIIIAPELFLSGFDYDNMDKASKFTKYAIDKLLKLVENQILVFTAIVKKDNKFENEAIVINHHQIIHRQSKRKLFKLGLEDKYFASGAEQNELVFSVNSVKYAILICFEIRFTPLWEKVRKADVIIVPAQWGLLREQHLCKLSQALSIANQCFVVTTSSGEVGKIANIATTYNPNGELAEDSIDLSEVVKMKRYIDMGIE